MRNAFANIIYESAKIDPKICVVVADISPAGSIEKFRKEFPNRFINTGVAEQSMIGIAAGMASCGMKPFCYTIATFALYRPLEFIRVDLCYQNLPVVVVGMGSGLVYSTLGGTHHSIEDVAIASSIPNMQVLAPCDSIELSSLTSWCINESTQPTYLRIGKAGEPDLTADSIDPVIFGKIRYVKQGRDIAIFSYGTIFSLAQNIAAKLTENGKSISLISVHTLKPLDNNGIKKVLASHKQVIVIEEHVEHGSLGVKIKSLAYDISANCKIKTFFLKDQFIHMYGSHDDLLREYGICKSSIVKDILHEE